MRACSSSPYVLCVAAALLALALHIAAVAAEAGAQGSPLNWSSYITYVSPSHSASSLGIFVSSPYDSWANFTVAIQRSYLSQSPEELISASAFNLTVVEKCADPRTADLFVNALLSGRSRVQVECAGRTWVGQQCPGATQGLCVDCPSPCSVTVAPLVFGIRMRMRIRSWPNWRQQAEVAADRVLVSYALESDGRFYCVAYLSSLPVFMTSYAINTDEGGVEGRQRVGTLTLTGLVPNSEYLILCRSEGYFNGMGFESTPPINEVLARANRVVTSTPENAPVLLAIVGFDSLVEGWASPAISLSFSTSVVNVSVQPIFQRVSSLPCGQSIVSYDVGKTEENSVSPAMLSFNAADLQQYDLFLLPHRTGCYSLRFEFVNSSRYDVVFQTALNNLTAELLLTSSESALQPVIRISSANFGMRSFIISIRFTGDTDMGRALNLPSVFSCGKIMVFDGSESAACWFTTPTLLRISPSTTAPSLTLQSLLQIKPQSLKPRCSVDPSLCAALDWLPAMNVTISGGGMTPKPVVESASQIQLGLDLPLAFSSSTGHMGRAWKQVQWTASFLHLNGSEQRMLNIENYLNAQAPSWRDCIPGSAPCNALPANFLTVPGWLNLRIALQNFVNLWGYAERTVQVTSVRIVAMSIVGPQLRNIFTNNSLTLRAGILRDENLCGEVTVTWRVYRDGFPVPLSEVRVSPVNNDVRTIVVPPYTLLAGHDYRFGVTLWCDNETFASDLVTIYTLQRHGTAIIGTGNSIALNMSETMSFDGSATATTVSVNDDFLYFWRCQPVEPISAVGCGYFDALKKNAGLVVFPSGSIFLVPGTYLVTLTVYIPSINLWSKTTQQVRALPSRMPLNLPTLRVEVPSLTIAGNYGYTVNATISSPSSFCAEWILETTNNTISKRSFVGGGTQLFPAVIPTNLLLIRSFFSFTLRAYPGALCYSDMSELNVAVTSFTVQINQGPLRGYLKVDPTFGNEATLFTIAAFDWQDPDLPISYSFYQCTESNEELLRNRMQIYFMRGQLIANDNADANITDNGNITEVVLKALIVDNLLAESKAFTKVDVVAGGLNVTELVEQTYALNEIVQRRADAETILPLFNIVAYSLRRMNCSEGDTVSCAALVEAGSKTLNQVIDKYNGGFTLVAGLLSYLRSFVEVDADQQQYTVVDGIEVYQYLTSLISFIGFSRGDGNNLVQNMLSSCDRLLQLLSETYLLPYQHYAELRSGRENRRYDLPHPGLTEQAHRQLHALQDGLHSDLLDSVQDLCENYFNYLPFGFSESFSTAQHFEVSMAKTYLEANSSMLEQRNVLIAGNALLTNRTLGIGYLVLSQHVFRADCLLPRGQDELCTAVWESKYLHLSMTQELFSTGNDVLLTLQFGDVDRSIPDRQHSRYLVVEEARHDGMNGKESHEVLRMESERHTLNVNCSELTLRTEVICTAEVTGGISAFTFPAYQCPSPRNGTVEFTCPRYHSELLCYASDTNLTSVPVGGGGGGLLCSFYVNLTQVDAWSQSSKATYSLRSVTALVSPPGIRLLGGGGEDDGEGLLESPYGISIIALVFIAVSGLLFTCFVMQRINKARRSAHVGLLQAFVVHHVVAADDAATDTGSNESEEYPDDDVETEQREQPMPVAIPPNVLCVEAEVFMESSICLR